VQPCMPAYHAGGAHCDIDKDSDFSEDLPLSLMLNLVDHNLLCLWLLLRPLGDGDCQHTVLGLSIHKVLVPAELP